MQTAASICLVGYQDGEDEQENDLRYHTALKLCLRTTQDSEGNKEPLGTSSSSLSVWMTLLFAQKMDSCEFRGCNHDKQFVLGTDSLIKQLDLESFKLDDKFLMFSSLSFWNRRPCCINADQ